MFIFSVSVLEHDLDTTPNVETSISSVLCFCFPDEVGRVPKRFAKLRHLRLTVSWYAIVKTLPATP